MSYTEIFPVPLVSNNLKASNKLKSGFKDASIRALSSSRSKNILSFKILANSDYSILSYDPKFPAFLAGYYSDIKLYLI
jgi:hypothetical protein